MRSPRSLSRALVVAASAAVLAAAGVTGVTPAQAVGVPPQERCFTLDGRAVACFTVGAEFTPAASPNYTAAGTLTLTIGCRSDYLDIATAVCNLPVSVQVTVDRTGVVPGSPSIEVSKLFELHVPKACFDDVCGPNAFDLPVYAPTVAGSIATVYLDGTAYPIGMPCVDCPAPDSVDIAAAAQMFDALLAVLGLGSRVHVE